MTYKAGHESLTLPPSPPESLSPEQLRRVVLPPATFPSVDQISTHGLYLLEHAEGLFVLVNSDVLEETVQELFGMEYASANMLPPGVALPQLATDLSLRLCTIVAAIRARRPPYLPLRVITPTDAPGRQHFAALLAEDAVGDSKSYVDVLCNAHAEIQAKLTS